MAQRGDMATLAGPFCSKPVLTGSAPHCGPGFTLVELIVVVAVIAVISAVAVPAFTSYRDDCSLKAAVMEICGMLKEAKQLALVKEKYHGVGFCLAPAGVSLLSDKGHDGKWNTADDVVVRSFSLAGKGGGLRFGYGGYGPLPKLAATSDGITFDSNNTAVCNPDLTGNAGTVYLISGNGSAMAIKMNSTDFGYTLWRWNGKKWVQS